MFVTTPSGDRGARTLSLNRSPPAGEGSVRVTLLPGQRELALPCPPHANLGHAGRASQAQADSATYPGSPPAPRWGSLPPCAPSQPAPATAWVTGCSRSHRLLRSVLKRPSYSYIEPRPLRGSSAWWLAPCPRCPLASGQRLVAGALPTPPAGLWSTPSSCPSQVHTPRLGLLTPRPSHLSKSLDVVGHTVNGSEPLAHLRSLPGSSGQNGTGGGQRWRPRPRCAERTGSRPRVGGWGTEAAPCFQRLAPQCGARWLPGPHGERPKAMEAPSLAWPVP